MTKATLKEYSEEEYDDFLDSAYWDNDWCIEVCWLKYRVCKVLYEVDPIAYNIGFSDWTWTLDDVRICSKCWEEFDNQEEADECCAERTDEEIEEDNKEVLSTNK